MKKSSGKIIQWYEPFLFARKQKRTYKDYQFTIFDIIPFGLCFVFMVLLICVSALMKVQHLPSCWLILLLSLFSAGVIVWELKRMKNEIFICRKGIFYDEAEKQQLIRFKNIAAYQITTDSRVPRLSIKLKKRNKVITFGISRTVSIDQIERFLSKTGLKKAEFSLDQ